MRKSLLFHHLVLNMILCFFVTSLFSCTDHIIQEQIIPDNNQENVWAFPLIINVGLSNDKTRINYEDNGTNGVKQIWEVGDQFILYNGTGDSLIYTLSTINTSNSSTATFQANSDTPIYSSSFTAVYINGNDIGVTFDGNGIPSYNLVMTGQTQTITDSLSHLKGYDLITCENITNLDEALNFASKGTLLTFRLTDLNSSIGTLESLSITASGATGNIFSTNYNSLSDTASISLNLGDYDSSTTSLTAYIITPPFNLPSDSELSIILAGTSTKLRYVGSFTNSKDYVAATRYDFPISSYAIFQNYTIQMDSLNPYYNADNWETVYKPTGSGTADDPYLLSTAWNLAWLKAISVTHPEYNSTSVYYKLTTNIYVEDDVNWKQIGFSSVAFKGHFDGDGNEITNLNISNSSHNSFFAMTDSATIKNLTVKGKLVNTLTSGGSYFAGIVGAAQNTTITNCNNYVNITNTYGGYSGGIVGQASGNTIIENCNNYGIIDCREFCGGLVGGYTSVLTGATISNCNNYGKVNGNYREIGGIVGITNDTILSITYCNNYASVLCPDTAKVIGGIVGSGYASQITYCKNEGEITGNTNLVGTILGLNNNSSTLSDTNTNTGTANGGSDLIGTGN